MNEEENNEQEEVQDSKIKQAASKAGKQIVDEAKRQISNKMKEVAAKIWAKVVAVIVAHLPAILIILAIIASCILLFSFFDDLIDGEVAETIDEVTYQSINEYCTIDESGVHFDKEKFVTTLFDKLKNEVGINLSDLGLGEIIKDQNGNEYLNPDSQVAEYLYKYMGASLSSELPYIEGSDEETKGTIKIKRTLNSAKYSNSVGQTPTSPTVTSKTIDTSKFGLTPENVNITMDNIKNEYKIAWVSDLHMMHPDQPTINNDWYTSHGTTFEQRNSMFNNSYLKLENIIGCLKNNDFDAIVFGGDIMDNYSDKNFEYLKRKIDTLSNKKVMFLVADHDYLTEMTTNSGDNTSASSLGVGGDIKKVTIGKDGDSINLVGQNYSNKQISDSNVSTINSYLNETSNSLFFTHVPVESKTQASAMQEWSRNVHNGQVYYWSKEASSGYNNPPENYLNTLYNSSSLKGLFAGHVHSSGDFELNTGKKEHIFKASFNDSIGVITITPSNTVQDTPVDIIEDSNNIEEIELKYIGYQKLQEMINSDDRNIKEQSLRYFSLDPSWNLCVTKWKKTSENGEEKSYEIYEVKIPYRRMISQYTVPFLFLIDLQMTSLNANYVEAVADLVKNQSFIDFTIFDSVTTDETTYTYKATRHTRKKHEETAGNTITTSYTETTEEEGPDVTVTKVEIDSIKANVTRAKTWIIDQTITYNLQENREYPYGEKPGKVEKTSESKPSGEGTWRDPIEKTWYEEIIKREWVKGATETKFMPSEFLGLWSNKTGKYEKGAKYLPPTESSGGKLVEYNMLDGIRMEKPVTNIIPSREILYDLLESNQTTQTHSEIMKEIINFYLTGEELTGETFTNSTFISVYDPDEFVEGSYTGDFDVHDESLFITDLETLKKALQGGYSQSDKLVANAEAFLNMQNTYKVNALFAASVSITETGGGRAGHAIDGCYNWFNITGTDGPYKTTVDKYGNVHHWRIYDNHQEGIYAFGAFIAGTGKTQKYYPQGNYTVGTIGVVYCPNTEDYPHQADDWIANTLAQISRFYNAAGLNGDSYIIGGEAGAGGVSGASGEGYRGKYRVGDKEYIEYLQYVGPWKDNPYMGGNMKNSGCSVTSVALILSGFGVDKNPEDVRRINPSGISIVGVLNSFGLSTNVIQKPTASQVLDHLKTGNPVIINAGHGYWSKSSGHYFAVLAVDGNKVYVSNVGSSSKTGWMNVNKVLEDNKKVIFIKK